MREDRARLTSSSATRAVRAGMVDPRSSDEILGRRHRAKAAPAGRGGFSSAPYWVISILVAANCGIVRVPSAHAIPRVGGVVNIMILDIHVDA